MSRVAVVQMVTSSNIRENLNYLELLFIQAQDNGAALLTLPENFAFMGRTEEDKLLIAEQPDQGEIQFFIRQLAKRYNMWVIAGTVFLFHSKQRVKTSSMVYNNNGENVARYDKIHLFDVFVSEKEIYQESATIAPGEKVVVVDTPIGRVGLTVCYDLRFPELYRQLVLQGAEIFTVPSAFTAVTGEAHWEVLLRARAIENTCYVIASNQGGAHENGRQTYGHSMIVDPWGKIVTKLEKGPGIIFADIDLTRLRQLRKQFPWNDHHRLNT